eukprot:tig00001130_g7245.t1
MKTRERPRLGSQLGLVAARAVAGLVVLCGISYALFFLPLVFPDAQDSDRVNGWFLVSTVFVFVSVALWRPIFLFSHPELGPPELPAFLATLGIDATPDSEAVRTTLAYVPVAAAAIVGTAIISIPMLVHHFPLPFFSHAVIFASACVLTPIFLRTRYGHLSPRQAEVFTARSDAVAAMIILALFLATLAFWLGAAELERPRLQALALALLHVGVGVLQLALRAALRRAGPWAAAHEPAGRYALAFGATFATGRRGRSSPATRPPRRLPSPASPCRAPPRLRRGRRPPPRPAPEARYRAAPEAPARRGDLAGRVVPGVAAPAAPGSGSMEEEDAVEPWRPDEEEQAEEPPAPRAPPHLLIKPRPASTPRGGGESRRMGRPSSWLRPEETAVSSFVEADESRAGPPTRVEAIPACSTPSFHERPSARHALMAEDVAGAGGHGAGGATSIKRGGEGWPKHMPDSSSDEEVDEERPAPRAPSERHALVAGGSEAGHGENGVSTRKKAADSKWIPSGKTLDSSSDEDEDGDNQQAPAPQAAAVRHASVSDAGAGATGHGEDGMTTRKKGADSKWVKPGALDDSSDEDDERQQEAPAARAPSARHALMAEDVAGVGGHGAGGATSIKRGGEGWPKHMPDSLSDEEEVDEERPAPRARSERRASVAESADTGHGADGVSTRKKAADSMWIPSGKTLDSSSDEDEDGDNQQAPAPQAAAVRHASVSDAGAGATGHGEDGMTTRKKGADSKWVKPGALDDSSDEDDERQQEAPAARAPSARHALMAEDVAGAGGHGAGGATSIKRGGEGWPKHMPDSSSDEEVDEERPAPRAPSERHALVAGGSEAGHGENGVSTRKKAADSKWIPSGKTLDSSSDEDEDGDNQQAPAPQAAAVRHASVSDAGAGATGHGEDGMTTRKKGADSKWVKPGALDDSSDEDDERQQEAPAARAPSARHALMAEDVAGAGGHGAGGATSIKRGGEGWPKHMPDSSSDEEEVDEERPAPRARSERRASVAESADTGHGADGVSTRKKAADSMWIRSTGFLDSSSDEGEEGEPAGRAAAEAFGGRMRGVAHVRTEPLLEGEARRASELWVNPLGLADAGSDGGKAESGEAVPFPTLLATSAPLLDAAEEAALLAIEQDLASPRSALRPPAFPSPGAPSPAGSRRGSGPAVEFEPLLVEAEALLLAARRPRPCPRPRPRPRRRLGAPRGPAFEPAFEPLLLEPPPAPALVAGAGGAGGGRCGPESALLPNSSSSPSSAASAPAPHAPAAPPSPPPAKPPRSARKQKPRPERAFGKEEEEEEEVEAPGEAPGVGAGALGGHSMRLIRFPLPSAKEARRPRPEPAGWRTADAAHALRRGGVGAGAGAAMAGALVAPALLFAAHAHNAHLFPFAPLPRGHVELAAQLALAAAAAAALLASLSTPLLLRLWFGAPVPALARACEELGARRGMLLWLGMAAVHCTFSVVQRHFAALAALRPALYPAIPAP